MKLIIAEKPAMGRDIAKALASMLQVSVGVDRLAQHVGDWMVIGAQGHMFKLVDAESYGDEYSFPWRISTLPVIPERFLLEPNFETKNGVVIESSLTIGKRQRLAQIRELLSKADEVVHAGDPDREGQSIVDDLLNEFGFQGPVSRLWLHAQTDEGIRDAWLKKKPNSDYGNLGIAAVARRESDWAIGINNTRAYSALWWQKGHKGLLQIGRVFSPLVGMIVQRENDIRNFVPVDHYSVQAKIEIDGHSPFLADWIKPEDDGSGNFDANGRLINRALAADVVKVCQKQVATVVLATRVADKEACPLLFSLMDLQKGAARLGYSPDQVLDAAQALYEKHKLTSYPRTECQYAPESEHLKAAEVFSAIKNNFSGQWTIAPGFDSGRKSRSWNDKKLGDHFAIIPLASRANLGSLSQCEKDVYQMICRQYIAQFFPPYEYTQTTLEVQVWDQYFRAAGRTPGFLGWRELFGGAPKAGDAGDLSNQSILPPVQLNDEGVATQVDLIRNKTKPPARFNAITLLEAMERAYLFATDPKVIKKLKQVEGIGTAATRAQTISKTLSSGLVKEDKSNRIISYYPTPKAFGYIQSIPPVMAKPDLTAWFEGKLEQMKEGSLGYAEYRVMLSKLIHHTLEEAKNGEALRRMPAPDELPEPVAASRRKSAAKTAGSKVRKPRKKTS